MQVINFFQELWHSNPSLIFIGGFVLIIGTMAKLLLFSKCNQPVLAAFIPFYDFIVTLKIVGRHPLQVFLLLIPVFNLFFICKVLIELAQSFGKYSVIDYFLILFFNIFYVMNLGLAFHEKYYGPVYGIKMDDLKERKVPMYA